jgi:opacity protein-like surface antigen
MHEMTVKSVLAAAVLATSVMGASPASAALQLVDILGYDMNNGHGIQSSFYSNYWDAAYGGPNATGNPFVDNSPLAGGKGILADGVIPTLRWDNYQVTPYPGPGQYVGWHTPTFGDPTIIFHLGGEPTITMITLYVDASNNGLVGAPSSVWINGLQYTPTANWTVDANCPDSWETGANAATCAQKLTISGSWTTNEFTIKPVHGEQPWIFLSEVQFATNAVPELSTWIMMLVGFAGVGFVAYRRQRKANPVAA